MVMTSSVLVTPLPRNPDGGAVRGRHRMNDLLYLQPLRKIRPCVRPAAHGDEQIASFDHLLFVEAEIMPRRRAEGGKIGLLRPRQMTDEPVFTCAMHPELVHVLLVEHDRSVGAMHLPLQSAFSSTRHPRGGKRALRAGSETQ